MQLTVLPLLAERMVTEFDVFEELENTLEKNKTKLEEGDVIVISTKYISNSQGRIVDLEKIKASEYGEKIANEFNLKPGIAEVIIRESDKIFGGIAGNAFSQRFAPLKPGPADTGLSGNVYN